MPQIRSASSIRCASPTPMQAATSRHSCRLRLSARPQAAPAISVLHLRLPSLLVLPGPQRLRVLVAEDVAALRVALQRSASAIGDVPQVAQQRGLVPLFDLAVQLGPRTDRVEEVADMDRVAAGDGGLLHFLALRIVNGVAAI